jgi:DNA repair photolyase
MRWDPLRLRDDPTAVPALFDASAVSRTFHTPEFDGLTFYEIHAKSIINRVPAASRMPFQYTINPYRGCSHACTYCFARKTHEYLNLDTGTDFDTKVIVKVNAPALLRRELARPTWHGDHIAMGTNVDCYQRAEGRYRLMPGIITALRDAANPFSILTKGTLILRDLPLLEQAATVTSVSAAVSVATTELPLWRSVEPGTPRPAARLAVCRRLTDAGIDCSVLMAPILPYLSDSPEQLDTVVTACAAAGATSITPIVLHLRPGAREWFLDWLGRTHPDLVPRYRQLYAGGAYASKTYQHAVTRTVQDLAAAHGITGRGPRQPAAAPPAAPPPDRPSDSPPPTLF